MSNAPSVEQTVAMTDVQKWTAELEASARFLEGFHIQAGKVVDRFVDKRADGADTGVDSSRVSRLNLFHANIITLLAMMYEKLPKVEADRRFADPNDDVARVAAEIITRILAQ